MPCPRATFHLGLPPKLKEVCGDHISRPSRLWEEALACAILVRAASACHFPSHAARLLLSS